MIRLISMFAVMMLLAVPAFACDDSDGSSTSTDSSTSSSTTSGSGE